MAAPAQLHQRFLLLVIRELQLLLHIGAVDPAARRKLLHRQVSAFGRVGSQIPPKITARDVSELPLLTVGAHLYGSGNNAIGKKAAIDVCQKNRNK
ncbi:MAG: hypothetical protein ABI165_04815 [Bryobacteraceae bacterium]